MKFLFDQKKFLIKTSKIEKKIGMVELKYFSIKVNKYLE